MPVTHKARKTRCSFTRFILFAVLMTGIVPWVSAEASPKKLRLTASMYPLSFIAGQVGGNHVQIINIMPPGSEPHSFEPTPRSLQHIYNSQIFLYHGGSLDTWAERIRNDLEHSGVTVLEMVPLLSNVHKLEGIDHHSHKNSHGPTDPHTWLDPMIFMEEVNILEEAFIKVDPANSAAYRLNSTAIKKSLHELHAAFVEGLMDCKKRDVIVTHDAYSYLARRYNIRTHAITGLSPDEEPSTRKLGELSRLAREMKMNIIFFDALVSDRLAKTIALEAGASTLVLNPLASLTRANLDAGENYFSIMKKNLAGLRLAMECR